MPNLLQVLRGVPGDLLIIIYHLIILHLSEAPPEAPPEAMNHLKLPKRWKRRSAAGITSSSSCEKLVSSCEEMTRIQVPENKTLQIFIENLKFEFKDNNYRYSDAQKFDLHRYVPSYCFIKSL